MGAVQAVEEGLPEFVTGAVSEAAERDKKDRRITPVLIAYPESSLSRFWDPTVCILSAQAGLVKLPRILLTGSAAALPLWCPASDSGQGGTFLPALCRIAAACRFHRQCGYRLRELSNHLAVTILRRLVTAV